MYLEKIELLQRFVVHSYKTVVCIYLHTSQNLTINKITSVIFSEMLTVKMFTVPGCTLDF